MINDTIRQPYILSDIKPKAILIIRITTNKNIETLEHNIALLEDSEEVIEKFKINIDKLDKMAPIKATEEDIVVLLGTLLSRNKLSSPERFSWTKEKETTIETLEIREKYDVYSYSATTMGTSENIWNFMRDLKTSVRLLDIKSIKMAPLANDNIEFNFVIWAYNQKNYEG